MSGPQRWALLYSSSVLAALTRFIRVSLWCLSAHYALLWPWLSGEKKGCLLILENGEICMRSWLCEAFSRGVFFYHLGVLQCSNMFLPETNREHDTQSGFSISKSKLKALIISSPYLASSLSYCQVCLDLLGCVVCLERYWLLSKSVKPLNTTSFWLPVSGGNAYDQYMKSNHS